MVIDTASELRRHVHPEDIGLWCRIIPLAFDVARDHRLDLRELLPDSVGDADGHEAKMSCFGHCYERTGQIRIVMRFRHPRTGEWMGRRPEADIWRTVAHELCHLEEARHSPRFWTLHHNLYDDVLSRAYGTAGRDRGTPRATTRTVHYLGGETRHD